MAFPYLTNPAILPAGTAQELDSLVALLNAYLAKEHNPDGTHGAVQADSLIVNGDAEFQDGLRAAKLELPDEDDKIATLYRTVAGNVLLDIETNTRSWTFGALTIRSLYGGALGTLRKVIAIGGLESSGPYIIGPGVRLMPEPDVPHNVKSWDVAVASPGSPNYAPAIAFGDVAGQKIPLLIRDDSATSGNYVIGPDDAVVANVQLGRSPTNQRFVTIYLRTGVYERNRTVAMGEWTDVPFNAADFGGSGSLTWTVTAGNIITRRYALVGKTMVYSAYIQGSSVGGTPNNELHIAIPSPFTAAHHAICGFVASQDIGAAIQGNYTQVTPGATYVILTRPGNVNWSVGSGTAVYFTATFEIS